MNNSGIEYRGLQKRFYYHHNSILNHVDMSTALPPRLGRVQLQGMVEKYQYKSEDKFE